jgi:ADP-ribose pyrophosphatase
MGETGHPRQVTVDRRAVVLDDFFRVEEAILRYERFDGTMSPSVRRLKVDRGDSVAILLHDPDAAQVLLVEQFKYPAYDNGRGWIVEVVAGMIDGGESPEAAVRREVLEETGYQVLELRHISTFFLSPGGSSERAFLFYGEVGGVVKTGSGGGLDEEGEDIALRRYTVGQAFDALDRGDIVDAKTIIALQWLRGHLPAQ